MNKQLTTRIYHNGPSSRVAELNNLGVKYFQANSYQEAVGLFRDALEWITSPLRESGGICASQSLAFQASGFAMNACAPILKARAPSDDCANDNQPFLRFSQALEVTECIGAYSGNDIVNEVIMSAIIIWNMGLVYHCSSQGKEDRLRRATALYLKSWTLVEAFVSNGSSGNLMVDFFTQALLNNLGSCSQELGHVQDARMWSDHLICYAQTITVSFPDEPMDSVSEMLQEQTNNFVLNAIMRLQCRPSFLAPAA